MTTSDYAVMARDLANSLFANGPPCKQKTPCLRREAERALTEAEKLCHWSSRPFWAYEPNNLCAPCLAYWHAEQAAQALERLAAIEERHPSEGK